jgi:hypothetical protein
MADHEFWGDGYVPRVNARARNGVDLALAPDLLRGTGPIPSWAIVDAPTAEHAENMVAHLRQAGVRVLVDTQAWRFADERTWQSPRWGAVHYLPGSPFRADPSWVQEYVRKDLLTQARLGADAVLLPNWFQALDGSPVDVMEWVLEGYLDFRRRGSLLRAVSFLPMRIRAAEQALGIARALAESGEVEAIVAQFERVAPLRSPVGQLTGALNSMLEVQAQGLPVLAGRFGSIGVTVRGVGVAAAECGPAEDQTFDVAAMVRNSLPRTSQTPRSGPMASPIWFSELGQTVASNRTSDLRQNRRAHAEIFCRRPCHQFRVGRDSLATAAWHSLLARMEEATHGAVLPPSMRLDAARRHLTTIGDKIDTINHALTDENTDWQLGRDHVASQQAVLAHAAQRHGVA